MSNDLMQWEKGCAQPTIIMSLYIWQNIDNDVLLNVKTHNTVKHKIRGTYIVHGRKYNNYISII